MRGRLNNVPLYQDFVKRQRTISLYRSFLRASKKLPVDSRKDVENQIKMDFRRNSLITDAVVIKSLTQEANRSMRLLLDMISSSSGDSWLNTSEENGRVGVGWPWERRS